MDSRASLKRCSNSGSVTSSLFTKLRVNLVWRQQTINSWRHVVVFHGLVERRVLHKAHHFLHTMGAGCSWTNNAMTIVFGLYMVLATWTVSVISSPYVGWSLVLPLRNRSTYLSYVICKMKCLYRTQHSVPCECLTCFFRSFNFLDAWGSPSSETFAWMQKPTWLNLGQLLLGSSASCCFQSLFGCDLRFPSLCDSYCAHGSRNACEVVSAQGAFFPNQDVMVSPECDLCCKQLCKLSVQWSLRLRS